MADVSDVENVLVTTVANMVYPNGTSMPSIVNTDIRVGRGFPLPKSLDADLANNAININIAAVYGMYKQTTRFEKKWRPGASVPATLVAIVDDDGRTITMSGTVSTPQSVMSIVNGVGYPYVVLDSDTLDSIASGIAALVPDASSSGAVVSIPDAYSIIARIGVQGNSIKEVGRQQQVFEVTVWTTTSNDGYLLRDSLCGQLTPLLDDLVWIDMPDGFQANIWKTKNLSTDNMQKERLLWRSLYYTVEYATTLSQKDYTITETLLNLSASTFPQN